MFSDKEELNHYIDVLEETKEALSNKDAPLLKDLSNNTIHSASSQQDSASITIAVIVYALSKLVEREDYQKIKDWNKFVKKFNSYFSLAIKALKQENYEAYQEHVQRARKTLESHSVTFRVYIDDVLKKASINKGSKIYEHGVSLEQTAKLLGVTQWELSDYIGQKTSADVRQAQTIDVKTRAKMAMEFFS
jgi:hypothetical protein